MQLLVSRCMVWCDLPLCLKGMSQTTEPSLRSLQNSLHRISQVRSGQTRSPLSMEEERTFPLPKNDWSANKAALFFQISCSCDFFLATGHLHPHLSSLPSKLQTHDHTVCFLELPAQGLDLRDLETLRTELWLSHCGQLLGSSIVGVAGL